MNILNYLSQCYAMYWIQKLNESDLRSCIKWEHGEYIKKTGTHKVLFISNLHALNAYNQLLKDDDVDNLDIDYYLEEGGDTIHYSYSFPGLKKFESGLDTHEYSNKENWSKMKRRRLHFLNN